MGCTAHSICSVHDSQPRGSAVLAYCHGAGCHAGGGSYREGRLETVGQGVEKPARPLTADLGRASDRGQLRALYLCRCKPPSARSLAWVLLQSIDELCVE